MSLFRRKSSKATPLTNMDALRVGKSRRSDAAALLTRDVPKFLKKNPEIHQFFTRGYYSNDLMRMDDFINALVDADEREESERSISHKKRFRKKRSINDDVARDVDLLREVIQYAHIAIQEQRNEAEITLEESRMDLIVDFRQGNPFWSFDDDVLSGFSARFTLIREDGSYSESFAYAHDGSVYVTKLRPVDIEIVVKESMKRSWPEIDQLALTEFSTLDEAFTRAAGYFVTSEFNSNVNGRQWWSTQETVEDFHERLVPESDIKSTTSVMDSVTPQSLFMASYGALETLAFAMLAVFVTFVAWKPGFFWTIAPFFAAVAMFAVMIKLFNVIRDKTLNLDSVTSKFKPDPDLWRLATLCRAAITLLSTCVMAVAAAMASLRVGGSAIEDFSVDLFFTLWPTSTLLGIGVWCAVSRRFMRVFNLSYTTDSMRRFSTAVDAFIGSILIALSLMMFFWVGSNDQSSVIAYIAFAIGSTAAFTAIAVGVSSLLSAMMPLRTLQTVSAVKYVNDDVGTHREEWSDSRGVSI